VDSVAPLAQYSQLLLLNQYVVEKRRSVTSVTSRFAHGARLTFESNKEWRQTVM
jgi:hypothetical protein